MNSQFTVHHFPSTMRYLFTVFHGPWLMANGKCMVNCKRKMVDGRGGGVL